MSGSPFDKRWSDYLHGQPTLAEDHELAELLTNDAGLRERALRDVELHGLLMELGREDQADDVFLHQVAARLKPAAAPRRPAAESPTPPWEWNPTQHPDQNPNPPAAVRPLENSHLADASRSALQPLPPPIQTRYSASQAANATPARERRPSRPSNQRRWATWSIGLALVGLIAAGPAFLASHNDTQPLASRPLATPKASPPSDNAASRPRREVPRDRTPSTAPPEVVFTPRPTTDSPPQRSEWPPLSAAPTGRAASNPRERPPTPDSPIPESPTLQDPFTARPTEALAYGRIIEETQAEWESPAAAELRSGPLHLLRGIATLAMSGGAVVSVRGPAEFELVSPQQISLSRGWATAVVNAEAVGFSVTTPAARIVDLGTEFVVGVSDSGATSVRVVRGAVEVSAAQPDATNQPERRWKLTTGQYKWLSEDGLRDFDWRMDLNVDEESFTGTLHLYGREFPVANAQEFLHLYGVILQELSELGRSASWARQERDVPGYRAEIHINGRRYTIENLAEYQRTYRRVNEHLRRLWNKAVLSGGNAPNEIFEGSFHFQGQVFRTQDFDELLKLLEQIQPQPIP